MGRGWEMEDLMGNASKNRDQRSHDLQFYWSDSLRFANGGSFKIRLFKGTIYTHTYMNAYPHAHTHILACARKHTHTHTYMRRYESAGTHTYIQTHTDIHTITQAIINKGGWDIIDSNHNIREGRCRHILSLLFDDPVNSSLFSRESPEGSIRVGGARKRAQISWGFVEAICLIRILRTNISFRLTHPSPLPPNKKNSSSLEQLPTEMQTIHNLLLLLNLGNTNFALDTLAVDTHTYFYYNGWKCKQCYIFQYIITYQNYIYMYISSIIGSCFEAITPIENTRNERYENIQLKLKTSHHVDDFPP